MTEAVAEFPDVERPLHVTHLVASAMIRHGPTEGILAQMRATPRTHARFTLLSMYAPPPSRSAEAAARDVGAEYGCLNMAKSFWDVRVLGRLRRQLIGQPTDILHCHLFRANMYGRLAARLAPATANISTLRAVERYMQSRSFAAGIVRAAERWTSPWVDRYVCVGDAVREAGVKRLGIAGRRIKTILNAVDLSEFEQLPTEERKAEIRKLLRVAERDFLMMSVGLLTKRKNHAATIEAMSLLVKSGVIDCRLLIAGDGPERERLESLIQSRNLASHVRLLGFRSDVVRLLPVCDAFVLLSESEGLPRALMEAMAAGLPCVASRAGANGEAVVDDETGFLVDGDDWRLAAKRLRRLATDRQFREMMGAAARRRAFEVFSPVRLAAQTFALYCTLLNGKGGFSSPSEEHSE